MVLCRRELPLCSDVLPPRRTLKESQDSKGKNYNVEHSKCLAMFGLSYLLRLMFLEIQSHFSLISKMFPISMTQPTTSFLPIKERPICTKRYYRENAPTKRSTRFTIG